MSKLVAMMTGIINAAQPIKAGSTDHKKQRRLFAQWADLIARPNEAPPQMIK